jgi:hypothetical protein
MEQSVIKHIMKVSPDDEPSSHILAIFHLSSVQGWVYIAMMDELDCDLQDDIEILVKGASAVEQDGMSVLWENTDKKVLDLGSGPPWINNVVGKEFLQTFICLSQPPPSYYMPDDASVGEWVLLHSFSVGQWVCVSCTGTYFGDVGCVVEIQDMPAPYIESVVLLLTPQMVSDAEAEYCDSCFI